MHLPGIAVARNATVSALGAASAQVVLDGVSKSYRTPAGEFVALRRISLELDAGTFVTVVGPSGSGKSTLLHLLTGIDRATEGSVRIAGTRLESLDEARLARWRGRSVGIVFQFFQLLPTLTALENVMLPMDLAGSWTARVRRERATTLLERVGIVDQAHKLPATLSGGQQQRVAIARALANDPPIVVADEPTGNLDSRTAASIWELLHGLTGQGKTVVAVTHERGLGRLSAQIVALADGQVVDAGFGS